MLTLLVTPVQRGLEGLAGLALVVCVVGRPSGPQGLPSGAGAIGAGMLLQLLYPRRHRPPLVTGGRRLPPLRDVAEVQVLDTLGSSSPDLVLVSVHGPKTHS